MARVAQNLMCSFVRKRLATALKDVYGDEYTCSYGYECKDNYKNILCDGDCDDDKCCKKGKCDLSHGIRFGY